MRLDPLAAKINEETQKLGQHSIKLKQLHYSLTREDDLQRSKKDMADFFEASAQGSALQLHELEQKVKQLDSTVVADAERAARAQLIHRLGLSVQGLVGDLGTHRPLTSHLIALKKLAHADPVVATVVGSIPASAAKEGVADEISSVSRALRKASDELRDGSAQERTFGAAASSMADFADTVRDKDLGQMVDDLGDFARRNPVAFLGGAALLGFAGVRMAKASRRARLSDEASGRPGDGQPSYGGSQGVASASAHPSMTRTGKGETS